MSETSIGFVTLGDIPVRRLLELVTRADASGMSTVWVTDEPFFRGALPTAVACALQTSRIRIGLGVLNPYDHPPAWMAKDFATLQELAGGRAVLGIGASWRPPIEAQGIPWTKPLAAVRESVHIVRGLLAGGPCSYEGEKFRVQDVQLGFTPEPEDVIVHVASMFPKSLAQSGQIADGVILSILCPAPYVHRACALVEEGARAAGRNLDGFEIVQYLPMEIGEDRDAARASVKRYLSFFIRHSYGSDPGHWQKVAELGEFDLEEFAAIHRRLESGDSPEQAVPDGFLDRFAVAGTPNECLDLLAGYKQAGTTEAVGLFPPWADLESQIELVSRRLVPEWQRL